MRLTKGRGYTKMDRKMNAVLTLQSSPEYKVRSTNIMTNQESSISQAIVKLFQSGNDLRMNGCLSESSGRGYKSWGLEHRIS